jgi:hypothetical protein
MIFPALLFLFRIVLAIQGLLFLHKNFRIDFSIFFEEKFYPFCFMYLESLLLGAYTFNIDISSLWIELLVFYISWWLCLLICFCVLGFELRALCLLGRRSTTWVAPPALNRPSHYYVFLVTGNFLYSKIYFVCSNIVNLISNWLAFV